MKLYNDPARQKLAGKVQQVRVVKQDQKFGEPTLWRSFLHCGLNFEAFVSQQSREKK